MKTHFFLITGIAFLLFILLPDYHVPAETPIRQKPVVADSIIQVRITFTGDLMCHVPQYMNSKLADGTYDFNPSFEYVKPYLHQADLSMGNLETTFAGTGIAYAGYPTFNSPDSYMDALKNAGFGFLVTANNHSMDTEEKGLLRTIDIVRKAGVGCTGTFKTQQDHDSVRILNLKGIKLGVLNYTYGTNGAYPSADHRYMLNVIDTLLIQHDIIMARAQGAELVLVYFHYGLENKSDPTADQKLIVRKTQEYGADLIIGGHPHVISPVGYYKTNKAMLDSGVVVWSLGNFLSNQYKRYTDAGIMLTITLSRNTATHRFLKPTVDYIPTWVYRATGPKVKKHIVLPAEMALKDSLPEFIDSVSRQKMKEAFADTKAMMGKYTSEIKLKSIYSH
jgi:poly-gamma-glutamate capsule biosynthesis protein CapA/YwtB (metallophosphatase superfamily)